MNLKVIVFIGIFIQIPILGFLQNQLVAFLKSIKTVFTEFHFISSKCEQADIVGRVTHVQRTKATETDH